MRFLHDIFIRYNYFLAIHLHVRTFRVDIPSDVHVHVHVCPVHGSLFLPDTYSYPYNVFNELDNRSFVRFVAPHEE